MELSHKEKNNRIPTPTWIICSVAIAYASLAIAFYTIGDQAEVQPSPKATMSTFNN